LFIFSQTNQRTLKTAERPQNIPRITLTSGEEGHVGRGSEEEREEGRERLGETYKYSLKYSQVL